MNVCVQVFGRRYVYIPVVYDIAKSVGNSVSHFEKLSIYFPKWLHHFTIPAAICELSSFSHPHQPLLLSLFLSFIYLYLKFFGYVSWYVWSWLPNKGLNPCPLQWKWAGGGRGGPNHWTPREVSYCKSYNLFDYSHPSRWKVLFCGFDLHFPNDQWCWASY